MYVAKIYWSLPHHGYVLRRIMRRAIRFGRSINIGRHFLSKIISRVIAGMSGAYPHLAGSLDLQIKVANNEEDRFLETLDKGLEILHNEIKRVQEDGGTTVPGSFIFKLYDTYGFPVDIVRDVALEQGLAIDEPGFARAMEEQQYAKPAEQHRRLQGAPEAFRRIAGEPVGTAT